MTKIPPEIGIITMQKRLIGLTGGIATGKTTVSDYLSHRYQLPILDADIYAREAVSIGSPILGKILQRYGDRVKLADGTLNRKALGDIIFHDIGEKQWLEQQIHPFVRQRFQEEVEKSDSEVIVLAIPLLFEANLTDTVTEIWVVYCTYQQQIGRLISRNNLSESEAIARITNQLPITEKVAKADVVLDNNAPELEKLYQQIDKTLFPLGL